MVPLHRVVAAVSPGAVTAAEAGAASGAGAEAAAEALGRLVSMGVGRREGGAFVFAEGDRLRAAVCAMRAGAAAADVSPALGWRDFEGLAAEVLAGLGFDTERNVMLRAPRAEIDVAGTKGRLAVLVDCKHWAREAPSALRAAGARQAARARRYAALRGCAAAVPAVVTLGDGGARRAGGSHVVPIGRLPAFVEGLHGNVGGAAVIGGA